jgi:hypothetical protein
MRGTHVDHSTGDRLGSVLAISIYDEREGKDVHNRAEGLKISAEIYYREGRNKTDSLELSMLSHSIHVYPLDMRSVPFWMRRPSAGLWIRFRSW